MADFSSAWDTRTAVVGEAFAVAAFSAKVTEPLPPARH
jgi:hypothetical protein